MLIQCSVVLIQQSLYSVKNKFLNIVLMQQCSVFCTPNHSIVSGALAIVLIQQYSRNYADSAIFYTLQYTENKSFCEDLTEGKFSFPIIHGIHSDPGSTKLISILLQGA